MGFINEIETLKSQLRNVKSNISKRKHVELDDSTNILKKESNRSYNNHLASIHHNNVTTLLKLKIENKQYADTISAMTQEIDRLSKICCNQQNEIIEAHALLDSNNEMLTDLRKEKNESHDNIQTLSLSLFYELQNKHNNDTCNESPLHFHFHMTAIAVMLQLSDEFDICINDYNSKINEWYEEAITRRVIPHKFQKFIGDKLKKQ